MEKAQQPVPLRHVAAGRLVVLVHGTGNVGSAVAHRLFEAGYAAVTGGSNTHARPGRSSPGSARRSGPSSAVRSEPP